MPVLNASLAREEVERWASTLDRMQLEARELDRITSVIPSLSIGDGYRIQEAGLALRAARGEKIIGMKMGLTSKAKMRQMGVESPIFGALTDRMALVDGARFALAGTIHPKIEPEIAFLLARDLRGRPTAREALDACASIAPAMEIIDSRYRNFNFQLPDVVADNCSGSAFVVGKWSRATSEDFERIGNLGMVLAVDGRADQFGSSAAIYGHPAESLAELCRMLDARGQGLRAGDLVLAGASTQAIPLEAGHRYELAVQDLGAVAIST